MPQPRPNDSASHEVRHVESTLAELEEIIDRGNQTFFEVGNALTEIRERKLYREVGFATFEDWGADVPPAIPAAMPRQPAPAVGVRMSVPHTPADDQLLPSDDTNRAEPYLITLPAHRMRVDLAHLDAQRVAALFAELVYMTAPSDAREDPQLASALGVVQEALGVSQDHFHVALADLLGLPVDAI